MSVFGVETAWEQDFKSSTFHLRTVSAGQSLRTAVTVQLFVPKKFKPLFKLYELSGYYSTDSGISICKQIMKKWLFQKSYLIWPHNSKWFCLLLFSFFTTCDVTKHFRNCQNLEKLIFQRHPFPLNDKRINVNNIVSKWLIFQNCQN